MREGVFSKLLNLFDQQINPATEDKQDSIITAIQALGSNVATAIGTGVVTTNPGTPVQIASNDCIWIEITNPESNNEIIYYGDSNVNAASGSERGSMLPPGNKTDKHIITNTDLFYVDSGTSATRVTFTYGVA